MNRRSQRTRAPDPQPTPLELLKSPLDAGALDEWLERAERDPLVSAELDLVADVCAVLDREGAAALAPARPHRRRLALLAPIAAAAALLVWFTRTTPPLPSLADRTPPTALIAEWRGPSEALADEFRAALQDYAGGDLAAASAALARLLERSPEHHAARFYLAATAERKGEVESALQDYERVADAATGFLAEHARWRLANLALAGGDGLRAHRELEVLRSLEGEFAANAAALLEALDVRAGDAAWDSSR